MSYFPQIVNIIFLNKNGFTFAYLLLYSNNVKLKTLNEHY